MASEHQFRVRYWGTTGTFATPLSPDEVLEKVVGSVVMLLRGGALRELNEQSKPEAIREVLRRHVPFALRGTYGGNTTSIEIETDDALFILDAGSGVRELGAHVARRWSDSNYRGDRTAHVLLTHAHMDHTLAAPFVEACYDPRNTFHVWAPEPAIECLLAVMGADAPLRNILFPITLEMMRGIKSFQTVAAGDSWKIGATRIRTLALNHPGGCLAYCFERNGRRIVFASDHEQRQVPDPELCKFAVEADLFYTDAQYLRDEYEGNKGIQDEPGFSRKGWGHSTVEAAVETAVAAGVQRLHLGHHEPTRSDNQLAKIEEYARQWGHRLLEAGNRPARCCTIQMAYEGLELKI